MPAKPPSYEHIPENRCGYCRQHEEIERLDRGIRKVIEAIGDQEQVNGPLVVKLLLRVVGP